MDNYSNAYRSVVEQNEYLPFIMNLARNSMLGNVSKTDLNSLIEMYTRLFKEFTVHFTNFNVRKNSPSVNEPQLQRYIMDGYCNSGKESIPNDPNCRNIVKAKYISVLMGETINDRRLLDVFYRKAQISELNTEIYEIDNSVDYSTEDFSKLTVANEIKNATTNRSQSPFIFDGSTWFTNFTDTAIDKFTAVLDTFDAEFAINSPADGKIGEYAEQVVTQFVSLFGTLNSDVSITVEAAAVYLFAVGLEYEADIIRKMNKLGRRSNVIYATYACPRYLTTDNLLAFLLSCYNQDLSIRILDTLKSSKIDLLKLIYTKPTDRFTRSVVHFSSDYLLQIWQFELNIYLELFSKTNLERIRLYNAFGPDLPKSFEDNKDVFSIDKSDTIDLKFGSYLRAVYTASISGLKDENNVKIVLTDEEKLLCDIYLFTLKEDGSVPASWIFACNNADEVAASAIGGRAKFGAFMPMFVKFVKKYFYVEGYEHFSGLRSWSRRAHGQKHIIAAARNFMYKQPMKVANLSFGLYGLDNASIDTVSDFFYFEPAGGLYDGTAVGRSDILPITATSTNIIDDSYIKVAGSVADILESVARHSLHYNVEYFAETAMLVVDYEPRLTAYHLLLCENPEQPWEFVFGEQTQRVVQGQVSQVENFVISKTTDNEKKLLSDSKNWTDQYGLKVGSEMQIYKNNKLITPLFTCGNVVDLLLSVFPKDRETLIGNVANFVKKRFSTLFMQHLQYVHMASLKVSNIHQQVGSLSDFAFRKVDSLNHWRTILTLPSCFGTTNTVLSIVDGGAGRQILKHTINTDKVNNDVESEALFVPHEIVRQLAFVSSQSGLTTESIQAIPAAVHLPNFFKFKVNVPSELLTAFWIQASKQNPIIDVYNYNGATVFQIAGSSISMNLPSSRHSKCFTLIGSTVGSVDDPHYQQIPYVKLNGKDRIFGYYYANGELVKSIFSEDAFLIVDDKLTSITQCTLSPALQMACDLGLNSKTRIEAGGIVYQGRDDQSMVQSVMTKNKIATMPEEFMMRYVKVLLCGLHADIDGGYLQFGFKMFDRLHCMKLISGCLTRLSGYFSDSFDLGLLQNVSRGTFGNFKKKFNAFMVSYDSLNQVTDAQKKALTDMRASLVKKYGVSTADARTKVNNEMMKYVDNIRKTIRKSLNSALMEVISCIDCMFNEKYIINTLFSVIPCNEVTDSLDKLDSFLQGAPFIKAPAIFKDVTFIHLLSKYVDSGFVGILNDSIINALNSYAFWGCYSKESKTDEKKTVYTSTNASNNASSIQKGMVDAYNTMKQRAQDIRSALGNLVGRKASDLKKKPSGLPKDFIVLTDAEVAKLSRKQQSTYFTHLQMFRKALLDEAK